MDAKVKRIWPEWEIDAQTTDHGILGSGSFGDVYRIRRCLHGSSIQNKFSVPHILLIALCGN